MKLKKPVPNTQEVSVPSDRDLQKDLLRRQAEAAFSPGALQILKAQGKEPAEAK